MPKELFDKIAPCHLSLLTLPVAAKYLGIPVSALRRAVNAGHIPTHTVFNSRKRVRLTEVIAAISAQGGLKDE